MVVIEYLDLYLLMSNFPIFLSYVYFGVLVIAYLDLYISMSNSSPPPSLVICTFGVPVIEFLDSYILMSNSSFLLN